MWLFLGGILWHFLWRNREMEDKLTLNMGWRNWQWDQDREPRIILFGNAYGFRANIFHGANNDYLFQKQQFVATVYLVFVHHSPSHMVSSRTPALGFSPAFVLVSERNIY